MYHVTRTTFDRWDNHPPAWVIGQVRRLADEFGPPGILAKTGQKNERVLLKGYLRLKWPTRELAERFQEASHELWGQMVTTRRYRNDNPLRYRRRRG